MKAQPDEGYVTLGVTTTHARSAEAVRTNARTMSNLYKLLNKKGVKEENIQTMEFSVADNYKEVWDNDPENPKQRTRKMVKDGFIVNNVVHVTVCELENFGEVLDAVTGGGATNVHSIQFGSSKSKQKLEEARKAACADALAKAKVLTEGLGVKLGPVISISEGYAPRPQPMYRAAASMESARADAVPVSGGTLSFNVSVTVTWRLLSPHAEHNQNKKGDSHIKPADLETPRPRERFQPAHPPVFPDKDK